MNRELKQHCNGSINYLKQGQSMQSLEILIVLVLQIIWFLLTHCEGLHFLGTSETHEILRHQLKHPIICTQC